MVAFPTIQNKQAKDWIPESDQQSEKVGEIESIESFCKGLKTSWQCFISFLCKNKIKNKKERKRWKKRDKGFMLCLSNLYKDNG